MPPSKPTWPLPATGAASSLQLQNGHEIKGPAIVQQPTTTIIVPTDFDLKVDDFNNYLMYRKGEKLAALVKRLGRSK